MEALGILFSLLLNQRIVSGFSLAETERKGNIERNNCFLQTNDGACLNRYSFNGIPPEGINVQVWIGILQITDIDDFHDTVDMSMWIQMFWINDFIQSDHEFSWMFVHRGWQTKIWYPEMEINRLIDLQLFKMESQPTSIDYLVLTFLTQNDPKLT